MPKLPTSLLSNVDLEALEKLELEDIKAAARKELPHLKQGMRKVERDVENAARYLFDWLAKEDDEPNT